MLPTIKGLRSTLYFDSEILFKNPQTQDSHVCQAKQNTVNILYNKRTETIP